MSEPSGSTFDSAQKAMLTSRNSHFSLKFQSELGAGGSLMLTESAAIVPYVSVSEYLQPATSVSSEKMAQHFELKLSYPSVRNTMARLTEVGHIFQAYGFSCRLSPVQACQHYIESLPETPYISFKVRESVDRD